MAEYNPIPQSVLRSHQFYQLARVPKLFDAAISKAKDTVRALTANSPVYREQLEAMEWFRENLHNL